MNIENIPKGLSEDQLDESIARGDTSGIISSNNVTYFEMSFGIVYVNDNLLIEMSTEILLDGDRWLVPLSIIPVEKCYYKIDSKEAVDVEIPLEGEIDLNNSDNKMITIITRKTIKEPRVYLPDRNSEFGVLCMPNEEKRVSPEFIILVIKSSLITSQADVSNSMIGEKLAALRKGLKIFVRSLPTGARFNIYFFGSTSAALSPEPITLKDDSELEECIAKISSVRVRGETCLSDLFFSVLKDDAPRGVILMTDGELTDKREEGSILEIASKLKNTRIFTIGLYEEHYSEVSSFIVEQLAILTKCEFAYVKCKEGEPELSLAKAFQKALSLFSNGFTRVEIEDRSKKEEYFCTGSTITVPYFKSKDGIKLKIDGREKLIEIKQENSILLPGLKTYFAIKKSELLEEKYLQTKDRHIIFDQIIEHTNNWKILSDGIDLVFTKKRDVSNKKTMVLEEIGTNKLTKKREREPQILSNIEVLASASKIKKTIEAPKETTFSSRIFSMLHFGTTLESASRRESQSGNLFLILDSLSFQGFWPMSTLKHLPKNFNLPKNFQNLKKLENVYATLYVLFCLKNSFPKELGLWRNLYLKALEYLKQQDFIGKEVLLQDLAI